MNDTSHHDTPDTTPEKIIPSSPDFRTELAQKIAEIAPEVMSDGRLDVQKLRDLVNGDVETAQEKFGLFWPGKRAAQALAQVPTSATLVPAPEESEDWENTKNLFIEGDNLEVLKALQNSYRRKVKMIYIDPPYNTGKEFIYPDKFSEGLQGYLDYTGQVNEEGHSTESQKETSGRKHSNWLSMMYPRLQLAKSLLTDDGVIFISIDDNEQANLKNLCDEVFGSENHVGTLTWLKKRKGSFLSKKIVSSHEYCLVYGRRSDVTLFGGRADALESQPLVKRTNARSILQFPAGIQTKLVDGTYEPGLYGEGSSAVRLLSGVVVTKGLIQDAFSVEGPFIWSQQYLDAQLEKGGKIVINTMNFQPRGYKYDDGSSHKGLSSVVSGLDIKGTNEDAYEEGKLLFGSEAIMDYPKPVNYIKALVQSATEFSKDAIVLDFFSGSGTTAHTVMQLNAEDGGSRKHIQVQLPELTDEKSEAHKAGYKTIADISKERIRRAGKKIREDFADKLADRSTPLDTGFRVYKLAPSNFVEWDEQSARDDIEQAVLDFAEHEKPEAAPEALLAEIMLQTRMPLSAHIEKRNLQSGGWVYAVDGGNLIAYVAKEQITEDQANEIADLAPGKLVILDSAFAGNDALKINVSNIAKEKFIKEFRTI